MKLMPRPWAVSLGNMIGAAAVFVTTSAAAQSANDVPAKAAVCAACHGGAGGKPALSTTPILAGQTARYLYLELKDFQEGRRSNELMTPMVAGMTRDEMHQLADYFAAQKAPSQSFAADAKKAQAGKLKADENLCTMCRLGGFSGQNDIPKVAGQNYDDIVKQLADFKAHRRTNDAGNMTSVAGCLSDQDIENPAQYSAGL